MALGCPLVSRPSNPDTSDLRTSGTPPMAPGPQGAPRVKTWALTSAMAPPCIPFQASSSLYPLQSVLRVQACFRAVLAAWPVHTGNQSKPCGEAPGLLSVFGLRSTYTPTHCRGQLEILDCPLPICILPLTYPSITNDDDEEPSDSSVL